MKEPFITKNLDVSTAHITKEDSELLNQKRIQNLLIVYPYREGYFIYVPEYDLTQLKKTGFSKAFINLMKQTAKAGCKYLQLDCDGMTYDDLPTYNW